MKLLYVLVICLGGCAVDADTDDEVIVEQAGVSLNGVSLNGVSLNGVSLNGVSLNGVSLNGSSIAANRDQPLAGATLVGSMWTGVSAANAQVKIRVDNAQQGTGTNSDLWFYGMSYQATNGAWTSVCGTEKVLGVAGVWNATAAYAASTTQFTLACRGTSVAKCVELGYKPFKGFGNQLATCVRLLRADYCGNGTSYTRDGTTLNLYDNVGVQADAQPWKVEAEWGPTGARCVSSVLQSRFLTKKLALPPCLLGLIDLSCGRFRTNTLMIDELPTL
jgi:ADYC domain/Pentapeptide repeats (8 copies)